ncbi:TPA: hypothetical protein CPT96_02295 [Candidatus Gastranaerophilales bacterium HUM_10]|nr:MAG TPA: hypothetical protein CPT96_02295 [Candidatus Gastranaerophilales bacterium HUM_10]
MKKITEIILGIFYWVSAYACYAADKFDVLPDLPEPLASAAQASSVTTTDTVNTVATQSVGQEPNFISMIFSLVFVIILIYATGILYTKLNKFGVKALKRQVGDSSDSQVAVISTTPLGANKTLHVVELGGKRMLIGASANSIHLIKDLGNYPPCEIEEGEYSKIEIPNIRIPKIEIPKIEIPGFTKVVSKDKKVEDIVEEPEDNDEFEISEIYEEENPDGIIDKLFHTAAEESKAAEPQEELEHKVDPDEFALYKKYL